MTFAAVDLGASSGRVIVGHLEDGRMVMEEVHRFRNGAIELPTGAESELYWDILALWREVTHGLREAERRFGPLQSVGIDTWAVDYGLLDDDGHLLGNPVSHRSPRTEGCPERLLELVGAEALYGMNGLQVIPLNTVFQLLAEQPARLAASSRLLLIPDLLGAWLTGHPVAEVTNASTTGLLDPATRQWHEELLQILDDRAGVHLDGKLPELVEPGTLIGEIELEGIRPGTPLIAVGSHDTASAVVAVPAQEEHFAFLSCGTWSLLGTELGEPIRDEAARAANFTNELGADGTVRFLKNIMGLWVLNEAVRTWNSRGEDADIPELVAAAADCGPRRTVVDIDDMRLYPPGDMEARIAELAQETGQPVPEGKGQVVRCILDSLAETYRAQLEVLERVTGHRFQTLYMVGGGIQNSLLCQLTADATGRRVVAGPVEGTALGNLLVQARAVGALEGGLTTLRDVVRASTELQTYEPA